MSDPRQPFLRAIEQSYDDYTPRLVFADWLDENGDEARAKFIRLHCEQHRLAAADPAAFNRMDTGPSLRLLLKHRDRWLTGLPGWARAECGFSRGFPSVVGFTGRQLLDDGAAVRAIAPIGGPVWVRRVGDRAAAVFGCEHLAGVTELGLVEAGLTDDGVRALGRGPHLRRVRTLDLGRVSGGYANRLTDAAAEHLSATPALPALRELHLPGHRRRTAAGVRTLLESPLRAGLAVLTLHGVAGGGPGFAAAFRSPAVRVTGLEMLDLAYRRLTDAGADLLADSPALSRLVELDLTGNELTDAGAAAVLRSPHLRAVRRLRLADNPGLTDATARAILDDGRRWEWVPFTNCGVSAELQAAVTARCGFDQ